MWSRIQAGELHRAFSVFLFTPEGKLVLQQRAASKITFPRIWANTCCSHPLSVPEELVEAEALGVRTAARRKLEQELGIAPRDVPLDSFTWVTRVHYVGASAAGAAEAASPVWGEHEIDWILMCVPPARVRMQPNENEVMATREFSQAELRAWMAGRAAGGYDVSPWFAVMEQSGLLYKWWTAVLEQRLDSVLERGTIHRQHELQALIPGRVGPAPEMPQAFKACRDATKAAGPLAPITCGPVSAHLRAGAASASSSSSPASSSSSSPSSASTSSSASSSTAASSSSTAAAASAASAAASSPRAVAAFVPGASAAVPKQGAYGKVKIHKDSLLSQLSHLDEVFVMVGYKLGLTLPVKVAALRADASESEVFCEAMLCKVSRSFAMVIQQLPEHLRQSVCVFYLVLRGLDTVEDDMDFFKADNAEKLRRLRAFHENLLLPGDWKMLGVGEGDERYLLENFWHVNRVFQSLHKTDQAVIGDICRRMGAGMADFSGKDLREGTASVAEYNLYCHHVAGLVGEGLSRLFAAHGDEDPGLARELKLADDMGLFLQKTNIIRDYLEDLVDGRAFWPREIWAEYAPRLRDLRDLVSRPAPGDEGRMGRDLALECLNHHVADALALAPSCLRYMQKLHHPDVFKFCAIPQVMAIATLERLTNNAEVFTGVLKIRKGQALLLMTQAGDMQSVYAIFLRYSRLITAAIPKHHKAAFALAQRAGDEVEEICLANLAPERTLVSRVLLSPSVVAGVVAALAALVRHLYLARGSWGDGRNMPRITDSYDVAACVGVVACLAYLLGCGGMMFVGQANAKADSPPVSRSPSPTSAARRVKA